MFDVLALSMEIIGRPKAEVERVLLSRVDFTANDIPSMLFSAAHLSRSGGDKGALRLYQQAARLDPTRQEPYIMGLKLAQKLEDVNALRWACTGILTFAWGNDHETWHTAAEDAAVDIIRDLRKARRDDEADLFENDMAQARQRDLKIALSWTGTGNLDLSVEEPPGTICSYGHRQTPGGGVLVQDGLGSEPDECEDRYVCAFGIPGNYRVMIRHAWGDVVGKRARLTVTRYEGTPHEAQRTYTIPLDSREKTIRINLNRGRRTELAEVAQYRSRIRKRQKSGSLLQKMGRLNIDEQRAGNDFATSRRKQSAGFQPVVTVLNEGVTMNALAVVSGDRRYVRINAFPQFNTITDVFTFSFINGGNPGGIPGGGGGGGGGNPVAPQQGPQGIPFPAPNPPFVNPGNR